MPMERSCRIEILFLLSAQLLTGDTVKRIRGHDGAVMLQNHELLCHCKFPPIGHSFPPA